MTLKQLEAFYWAAKLGTFSIAARRLHLTQSSLSKRIAELEASLDQVLFVRTSKFATLTKEGRVLLPKVEHLLSLAQDIKVPDHEQMEPSGECYFGISELMATTWFPLFVNRLRQDYPKILPKPRVGMHHALVPLVVRGDLDFAVINGMADSEELDSEVIATVDFAWMSAPSRLGGKPLSSISQLRNQPFISATADSGNTLPLQQWMTKADVQMSEIMTCDSLTAIVSLTVAGVGISFMPRAYVSALIQRNLLVAWTGRPALQPMKYRVIWRRDDNRSIIQLMRKLILETVDFTRPNVLWEVNQSG